MDLTVNVKISINDSVAMGIEITHPKYTVERVAKLLADGEIKLFITDEGGRSIRHGNEKVGTSYIENWDHGGEVRFTGVFEIDGEVTEEYGGTAIDPLRGTDSEA